MDKTNITNKRRIFIFLDIAVTCIVSSMLATALTTALPSIVEDMGLSVATGQWLTSGYSLVMAIIMPLTAFLIARFVLTPKSWTKERLQNSTAMCSFLFMQYFLICILPDSFSVLI